MSEPQTIFKESSALAFDEEHWQKINYSTGCFENNFVKGKENYRNLELEKQRAYTLRNKSLLNTEKFRPHPQGKSQCHHAFQLHCA